MLIENFSKSLLVSRVESYNGRSWAIWDEDKKCVRVVRKKGKFHYGYITGEHHFLDYYEALFLIEMVSEQIVDIMIDF